MGEVKKWCKTCGNYFHECVCDDLHKKLNSVFSTWYFVYRCCKKCDKAYGRCQCENPEWELRNK